MKVSELIDSLGSPPPPPSQQISYTGEAFEEITTIYHDMYAGSLSSFFETGWYRFTDSGRPSFPKETSLIEQMALFLKVLESAKASSQAEMNHCGILETRVVWSLASTALRSPAQHD
jgi:white-opaque regulator 2